MEITAVIQNVSVIPHFNAEIVYFTKVLEEKKESKHTWPNILEMEVKWYFFREINDNSINIFNRKHLELSRVCKIN